MNPTNLLISLVSSLLLTLPNTSSAGVIDGFLKACAAPLVIGAKATKAAAKGTFRVTVDTAQFGLEAGSRVIDRGPSAIWEPATFAARFAAERIRSSRLVLPAGVNNQFSRDFQVFLNDFAPDFDWSGLGNFGGKIDPNDSFSKNAPIINFTGLGSGLGGELDNNSSTVIHFNKMGYKNQDHYVLRWTRPVTLDPRSILEGARKEYVLKARKFIEALLAYTGAECVNIIAFSYGNIVAGAAIKGGTYPNIAGENYYVGPPITDKICNYLGIGSPHSGAGTAQLLGEVSDATNDHIGVEPGSEFLINLEANPALLARQGGKIGSIRSSNNDLFIGPGWSRPFKANTHDWDLDLPHFKLIHQTTDLQYRFFHGMN